MNGSASDSTGLPCPPPNSNVKRPNYQLPAGACDTHVHVFGPFYKWPLSDDRSYTPQECSFESLKKLHRQLGISRGVIVQGGANGFDNRVTVDAIQRDPNNYRGVAVLTPDSSITKLKELDRLGIRGCRVSSIVRNGVGLGHLADMLKLTAAVDWHLLIHLKNCLELLQIEAQLQNGSTTVVLDHLAHITPNEIENQQVIECILRLLDTNRVWLKLASLYRSSNQEHPYNDMLPIIKKFVQARPDRLIWGSNWPHPICPVTMPNDGDLVDLIPKWIPNADDRKLILVDNPNQLYRFGD